MMVAFSCSTPLMVVVISNYHYIYTYIYSDREKEEKDIVLPFPSVPNG